VSTSALKAQLTDIPADWPALVREIVRRDGQAVRAGAGNSIEVKSLTTNQWLCLQLPGGAKSFATPEVRDAILAQILGENGVVSNTGANTKT
jgi:hypothetical protein